MGSRLCRGAAALLLVLAGCTPDADDDPISHADAGEAVEAVIEAWNDADTEALATASNDPDGAERLVRKLERVLAGEAVTRMDVAVEGEIPEHPDGEPDADGGVVIEIGYVITWDSEATAAPRELHGELTMDYEAAADHWVTDLSPSLLWPGLPGARGFEVSHEWPKRGTIRDRDGRILATGSGQARHYPFGTLAGSTIGHLGAASEADEDLGVDDDDLVGASGLEEAFQDRLGGRPTAALQVVNKRGKVLRILGRTVGEPSHNLKVTLDIELQRAAEQAYGDTVGGAAVIQPSTGDLLAVVDSSTFDPNNYVGAVGVEPFNRALVGGYPPGSSMKVVTAAAALDTGTVTPSTTVTGPKEYKGVRNFESGQFGSIPFASAVKFSVNTAFAQIAEELGAGTMTKYAERFGFNRPVEMDLQARLPSYPEPVGLADLMWSAVGQAQVLVNPMHMATVAATVANEGRRMEPRIDMSEEPHGDRVMKVRTATELTEMMRAAVEGGTGVNARIAGIAVAGKTGTAEVDVDGERRNHAWFICFAPVGAAELAVAVVSEYGGVGGRVAAPLARAILERTLPLAP